MTAASFIPEIVDQHNENTSSLWVARDNALRGQTFRLVDLARLDERIEANIDGLRIARANGWSASLGELEHGGAGEFFTAGVLAAENADPDPLDDVIECAFEVTARIADQPYHPAYDPWRGLVSALAWVDRTYAARSIERLKHTPRPRTRWLSIATCGARRAVRVPDLAAALADPEPLVRSRAARTIGELGRSDLRAHLNARLTDSDEECRFWCAWSAGRLGTVEGLNALAEFAGSPGPYSDRAVALLLRSLSLDQANAFLRPFASNPQCRSTVIRATGIIGDALYLPWLIGQTSDPIVARLAGAAFATITGVDLTQLNLDGPAPEDFRSTPSDDPGDDAVALEEEEGLPWPNPGKLEQWWNANKVRFHKGTSYFLGNSKASTDWLAILSSAFQHQRRAAALEIALRNPMQAMFEVRARAQMQATRLAHASR